MIDIINFTVSNFSLINNTAISEKCISQIQIIEQIAKGNELFLNIFAFMSLFYFGLSIIKSVWNSFNSQLCYNIICWGTFTIGYIYFTNDLVFLLCLFLLICFDIVIHKVFNSKNINT